MTYTYLHALIYKVPTGVTEFTQPLYNLPQFSRMSPSVMCMHTLWHTKQHKEYSGVSRGCASQCQMLKLYLCKIILKKERKVFGFILFFSFLMNECLKWQHEKAIYVRGWAVVENFQSPLPLSPFDLGCYFHKPPSALLSEQRTLTVAERPLVSFCSQFGYLTCFKIREHNICLKKQSVRAL